MDQVQDSSEAKPLQAIDDDTLLDMYDEARANEHESCDAIAEELDRRGIVVQPCGHADGIS